MTITEAAKSGRPFKRKEWSLYLSPYSATPDQHMLYLTFLDIISDDWIIQDEPIMITKEQFWSAYRDSLMAYESCHKIMSSNGPSANILINDIAKRLGFK